MFNAGTATFREFMMDEKFHQKKRTRSFNP